MPPVRAVLLRGPVPVGAVLLGVVELAMTFGRRTPGFELWADRAGGLGAASVICGMIATGTAALEANRWHDANRVRLRSAGRQRLAVTSGHVVVTLLPFCLALWISVGIVAGQAAAVGAYGGLPLLVLLKLTTAIVVAAMVGYCAGSALPYRWFVGPAVGLVFYAADVAIIIADPPGGLASLFPASPEYVSVFTRPVTSTLLAQSGFFLAVAGLALLVTTWRNRWSLPRFGPVAGLLAVALVAASVITSSGGRTDVSHNPGDFTCRGTRPVLCLNPGYAPAATALHQQFRRLDDIVAGTPLVAVRLEQNVQGIGDEPSSGARSVYLEQWAASDDLAFSVFRYVIKYGGAPMCADGDGAAAVAVVDAWLSGFSEEIAGEATLAARLHGLTSLSPAASTRWFRQHAAAYSSCSLRLDDLP